MKKSRKAAETIKVIVLILCCILFLLPVYFLVMNSFKSLNEILISFISLPKQFTLRNYAGAMEKINYLRTFGNTRFLTVGSVLLTLIVCSLAGYKIQRTRSKISKITKSYMAIGQMVPFAVIMVPLSQILGKLGINNNLPGLLFVYCAMYIPMMTFVYSGYCDSISEQLDEAATIDGCNQFQVFFHVILPLTKPILVTMAVLAAVWTWNDLLVALIAIDQMPLMTLTRRIQNFIGFQSGTEWDFFTASVTLAMVPIIVLYGFLQQYVQSGITAGAVKG